jgi:hypothetical protein
MNNENTKNNFLRNLLKNILVFWNKLAVIYKVIFTSIIIIAVIVWLVVLHASTTHILPSVFYAPINDKVMLDKIIMRIEQEDVIVTVTPDNIVRVQDEETARRMRVILIRENLLPSKIDPWQVFDKENYTITDKVKLPNQASLFYLLNGIIDKADVEGYGMLEYELYDVSGNESFDFQTFVRNYTQILGEYVFDQESKYWVENNTGLSINVKAIMTNHKRNLSTTQILNPNGSTSFIFNCLNTNGKYEFYSINAYKEDYSKSDAIKKFESQLEAMYREKILNILQSIFTKDRIRDIGLTIGHNRITVSVNIDGVWKRKLDEKKRPVVLWDGTIEREYVPVPLEELRKVEGLIRDAIGYNSVRGDSITVTNIPVDRIAEFAKEDAAYFRRQKQKTILLSFLVSLIIISLFFCLKFYIFKKIKFMQNLTKMRLTSMKNGNSKMTLDEINAVRKKSAYLVFCVNKNLIIFPILIYKKLMTNLVRKNGKSIHTKRRIRPKFMQNLKKMRLTSMKNGNSKMTLDEINVEINAVRKKRVVKEHATIWIKG